MGYHNELTWIQNGPQDEMAVTIFGIQSNNKINRVPSRIPISIKHSVEGDRYTEHPTRNRDREHYSKEVDVRYLRSIKKLRNKISSSYSCNQQLCPVIKQRMEEHLHRRHCKKHQDIDSQTVILESPCNRTSTKSGPSLVDNHAIQTTINKTNSELNNGNYDPESRFNNSDHDNHMTPYKHNIDEDNDVVNSPIDNTFDNSFPLKISETRSVLTPEINNYKDHLQKAVRQWFQDVPMYQSTGHINVDQDKFINDLTEKINTLSFDVKNESYERNLKQEIDSILKNVCMWYPGAKRDQDSFKNKLHDNLFKAINKLNSEILLKSSIDDNSNTMKCKTSSFDTEKIEDEVSKWFNMIKVRKSSGMHMNVDKRIIVQAIVNKVTPLLKTPINSCNSKTMIKCEIIEVLNNLPVGTKCSKTDINNYHLYKFAEDLANKLLAIKTKAESKKSNTQDMYQVLIDTNNSFIKIIKKTVDNSLKNTRFDHQDDLKIEITNIIMDYIDSTVPVEEYNVNKEIVEILKNVAPTSRLLASNISENILKNVKYALKESKNGKTKNVEPLVTRKTSVYTSERCCSTNFPAASTPKKRRKDSIPKLSPEEIEYAEKIGDLIRAWMDTLPEKFNAPDEEDFKETMIKDLAGEITDEAKLEQLASVDEKEKWLKYLIYKWLYKLDVFDLEEVSPQIEVLLKRVQDIPVPVLTKPQHGNRQEMANIQHMESKLGWEEYFVPKGRDILEDEISIWMNQQSDIFKVDRNTRSKKIHELAALMENKLGNKRQKNEIKKDLTKWLDDIVKNDQRTHVNELANHLKGRLVSLPHDSTLAANRDREVKERAEHLEAKRNPIDKPVKIKITDEDTINLDKTMQMFISKFIEHNYDVDDPMARGAFSHLLKTKLQRLNPPTRKEVYDNFTKTDTNKFSRENFIKELDYIKNISDWLKNIPISGSYNTVHNRERVDFVVDLARNILEIEEEREEQPDAMDYNMYMAAIISQFLVQLPIIEEYRNDKNMMFMIDQLVGRIVAHRNKMQIANDSFDTSGAHSDNIGDFIEEFIRVNGSDVGDDEVKLEAWSARLLDEIKKMVRDNSDPKALSKAQVYNRLTSVPKPKEESIKQFEDEFEYVKEISDWLKNLPLLPIDECDQKERIKMICVLTEKITERDIKKSNDSYDEKADVEFSEYIKKWISDLSLDESHEVVADIVIKQLINRIDRAKNRENTNTFVLKTNNTKSIESIPNISKKRSSKTLKARSQQVKNSTSNLVDAIEKWSLSLPIKADDEKTTSLKDDIAKKLFQKVGELSIDPRTFNDDLLYQEILAEEVDAIIDNISNSPDLQKNKDKFKTDLVQNVVEAQKHIKENYAGEYYKQKLEHSIEASIPHPVNIRRDNDPRFEIYKSRLAEMFILENFDHANDATMLKYERNLKNEIGKYCDSAKNKNAIPLTEDEIYYELYSVLFKVPIPIESALIGEVEEIKTRCEIDGWFEQLPLNNVEDAAEVLERDKILATLAKRIHEIEKIEAKAGDKIHKEIMRWINKLHFLPGEENNKEQFAKKLQDTLKSSADNRKYVAESSSTSKKVKAKSKCKEKLKVSKNDSHLSEPSHGGKQYESHLERAKPKKKAAEIIIDIVEEWCNQLPISAITPQEEETAKMMRANLCTKIIIKISELNMNPNTFNDVTLFNYLLDKELDILLADIPTCCDFEASKPARKMQLKDAIQSVKPLFRDEKARHQYKQDLDTTVAKVLGKPDEKADKEKLFQNLKDEIVENFIQYNYDKEDDEGSQVYKNKIYDAIAKFKNKEPHSNTLMKRNQLLCELAKVLIPSEVSYKDEVEEIRMKNEVTEFFEEQNISGDKIKNMNQVKSNLAKKLNEIELHGSNDDSKMKQEIMKSLKKVNKNPKLEVVENFVKKLKDNEMIRRAPRKVKIETSSTMADKISGVCVENTTAKELEIQDSQKLNNISGQNKSVSDEIKCENCDNSDTERKNRKLKETIRELVCHCDKAKENTHENRLERDRDVEGEEREMKEVRRCVCGRITRCFMPMRWYCGPEDFSVCKMPAGFYYY